MNERLVTFLYHLMRDTVPCGAVELVMRDHVEGREHSPTDRYSNRHLEAYARELVERLEDRPEPPAPPVSDPEEGLCAALTADLRTGMTIDGVRAKYGESVARFLNLVTKVVPTRTR